MRNYRRLLYVGIFMGLYYVVGCGGGGNNGGGNPAQACQPGITVWNGSACVASTAYGTNLASCPVACVVGGAQQSSCQVPGQTQCCQLWTGQGCSQYQNTGIGVTGGCTQIGPNGQCLTTPYAGYPNYQYPNQYPTNNIAGYSYPNQYPTYPAYYPPVAYPSYPSYAGYPYYYNGYTGGGAYISFGH